MKLEEFQGHCSPWLRCCSGGAVKTLFNHNQKQSEEATIYSPSKANVLKSFHH